MADLEGLTIDEALRVERGESVAEATSDEVSELDEVRAELGIDASVDPLSALLDAPLEPPTEEVRIGRLNALFVVQAITDDAEYDRIVERCTSYVKSRRGQGRTREVDGRRLARLTVATYCVKPSFTPKYDKAEFEALASKFGTREPEDLVKRALLMGEVDLLADKIMTLSGFDDEVETAGN
jgi:hypothetical protein